MGWRRTRCSTPAWPRTGCCTPATRADLALLARGSPLAAGATDAGRAAGPGRAQPGRGLGRHGGLRLPAAPLGRAPRRLLLECERTREGATAARVRERLGRTPRPCGAEPGEGGVHRPRADRDRAARAAGRCDAALVPGARHLLPLPRHRPHGDARPRAARRGRAGRPHRCLARRAAGRGGDRAGAALRPRHGHRAAPDLRGGGAAPRRLPRRHRLHRRHGDRGGARPPRRASGCATGALAGPVAAFLSAQPWAGPILARDPGGAGRPGAGAAGAAGGRPSPRTRPDPDLRGSGRP